MLSRFGNDQTQRKQNKSAEIYSSLVSLLVLGWSLVRIFFGEIFFRRFQSFNVGCCGFFLAQLQPSPVRWAGGWECWSCQRNSPRRKGANHFWFDSLDRSRSEMDIFEYFLIFYMQFGLPKWTMYCLELPPHPVTVRFIGIPYWTCNNPGGDWLCSQKSSSQAEEPGRCLCSPQWPKKCFAFVYFWLLPIRLDLDSLVTHQFIWSDIFFSY